MTDPPQRILVVCPTARDRAHLSRPEIRRAHHLEFRGTDEETHRAGFDGVQFLDETIRAVRDHRGRYRGVVGIDDFPACVMSAIIAEGLGFRSPSFESLFCCQHKYYSRLLQREAAPDAVPRFHALDLERDPEPAALPISLPLFVKPVKSYLSILARRIDTFPDLVRTVQEARRRLPVIAGLFDGLVGASRLAPRFRTVPGSALLVEEVLSGHHVTLDGYVCEGQVMPLGVVDSHFASRCPSFAWFEHPSQLPPRIQDRLADIAQQCIERIGLDWTFFNMEFFYREEDDSASIIEINGRMSSQFAPLYRMVDGIDMYAMQLDLALGRDPHGAGIWAPERHRKTAAASFVLRRFEDGIVTRAPRAEDLESFAKRFSEAFVEVLVTEGEKLSDELQDDYSYRYALVDLSARDRETLLREFARARELLPFTFEPIRPAP